MKASNVAFGLGVQMVKIGIVTSHSWLTLVLYIHRRQQKEITWLVRMSRHDKLWCKKKEYHIKVSTSIFYGKGSTCLILLKQNETANHQNNFVDIVRPWIRCRKSGFFLSTLIAQICNWYRERNINLETLIKEDLFNRLWLLSFAPLPWIVLWLTTIQLPNKFAWKIFEAWIIFKQLDLLNHEE